MSDIKIIVADSFYKRLRGVAAWDPMPKNAWLWLTPCRCIHTMMMRKNLTLVYLDLSNRICEIVPEISPWRISGCRAASSVLEANCVDPGALQEVIPHLQEAVLQVAMTRTR
jgi:uncharacterized membrane protein (UPF0127 family)